MMLALGMFVFERRTLPYQSMQHSKDYRWASNDRVGKPLISVSRRGRKLDPACRYALPCYYRRSLSLLAVELMADEGERGR
jgi:hypothetical protein